MMAIRRWQPIILVLEDCEHKLAEIVCEAGKYVLYAYHLAEVRERERAAFVEGSDWTIGRIQNEAAKWPSKESAIIEALRRYGGEA